jgi:hypothetical protein
MEGEEIEVLNKVLKVPRNERCSRALLTTCVTVDSAEFAAVACERYAFLNEK